MALLDSEALETSLNGYITGALSIYDVAKVMPHPYDSVAGMANHWAHDFIGFAFKLQKQVAETELELARLRTDLALAQLRKEVEPEH